MSSSISNGFILLHSGFMAVSGVAGETDGVAADGTTLSSTKRGEGQMACQDVYNKLMKTDWSVWLRPDTRPFLLNMVDFHLAFVDIENVRSVDSLSHMWVYLAKNVGVFGVTPE